MRNAIRLVLLASFVSTALAQFDSGQIAGFVRDSSQSVIPGASITVTNEGNGQKLRTVTNSSGYYVVPNLFVGSYSLEVETTGFKKSLNATLLPQLAGPFVSMRRSTAMNEVPKPEPCKGSKEPFATATSPCRETATSTGSAVSIMVACVTTAPSGDTVEIVP